MILASPLYSQHMVQSQMPPTYQFAAQPGLTQAGFAQAGLTQAGLAQAGLTQTGLTESGLAQAGLQDYTQVVVSQAMPVASSEATSPFKSEQSSFTTTAVTPNGGVEQQTQTDLESGEATSPDSVNTSTSTASQGSSVGPKRLHVSNIPFRFREADLKSLLGVG